jgi:biotin-(acetyl-CoA carboxylase) ligase
VAHNEEERGEWMIQERQTVAQGKFWRTERGWHSARGVGVGKSTLLTNGKHTTNVS